MDSVEVDVAVIGCGLVGAAAARHLSALGVHVAVIGPPEPTDPATHDGPFASHYDSGRITRVAAPDPVWAELAARSIARYGELEAASGIGFHRPTGLVVSAPELDVWQRHAVERGASVELVDAAEVAQRFGITLPVGSPALVEGSPAGNIDPRALVAAQISLACAQGAVRLVDAAIAVTVRGAGVDVHLARGPVRARRVLVAAGAFTNELLEEPLELLRRPRTVVMAETAARPSLPSLIWHPGVGELPELYWVPPVPYPDGRTRLKIGGHLASVVGIGDGEPLREWFRTDGDDREAALLREALEALLPDLDAASWQRRPCVTTSTAHGRPYIGPVAERVVVAAGGNGSAAKSSDEIGRLGVLAVLDRWDDSLNADLFAPVPA